jgi:hypothetical protein
MSFKSDWKKSSKFVLEVSEKVVRGTALTIFSAIVKASPVKTGRFRGNWQTTLAQPAQGELGLRGAGSAIAEIQTKTRSYKVGQTLFMANNLPYAYALSRGSSRQAPNGWIEAIIMGFQKTVDSEAKKQ